MPVWPKSIITLGANVLTARTALRLRRSLRDTAAQQRAFRTVIGPLARTSFWKAAGIRAGMRYEDFRSGVSPRTQAAIGPAVARMQAGEADVLWPGGCQFFVASAGTGDGVARSLPVTPEMFVHFRAGCRDALLYYTARVGHARVFRGRHLFVGGSTSLRPVGVGGAGQSAVVGEWPAIAALNLPAWAEAHLYEPGAAIAGGTDWPAKIDAIVTRTTERDVTLLAGMPPWILAFAEALQARNQATVPASIPATWPNLECLVHGGIPIGPYEAELRSLLGPKVTLHEVYAGAEGFFAAQDGAAAAGLRVMANLGLFFEFVPLADFDAARPDAGGTKAVRLHEVQAGVDYVVLLTSPAGLARYVNGDIVRFTSTQPPRLQYVGRVDLMLTAFGERVLEKELTDALVAICQQHRWSVVNFHVAPLFDLSLTGQARGRHEWWVELRPGTVETPTGPQMAAELDVGLQRLNREYAGRRQAGRIEAPTVRLVMPGVFRHWLRFHGRLGGHYKVARCRSDRLIADELAQITKFARD